MPMMEEPNEQKRLVLCFDGTGNKFQGDASDTNIVKIFQMLDRHDPDQFHYYQPGIGTYSEKSLFTSLGLIGKFLSGISAGVDQAIGTSFVDHVTAGYRFLMRYYSEGDAIYIFGFSRGAYTARFLAEMLHTIGLLSRGNEEMVRFAWDTFAKFQQTRGDERKSDEVKATEAFMINFKTTFCRPSVNVHFLGLFDCVNSVGQFELPFASKSFSYIAKPPATHIRHAVSIHERRLKFKPALFVYDQKHIQGDTVEVWFSGNHGDVGGGWGLRKNQPYLLSDIPLQWMINEAINLPKTESKLAFTKTQVEKARYSEPKIAKPATIGLENEAEDRKTLSYHDLLSFGAGASWFAVLLWWIIEILPIFTRLELEHGKWVPRHWPPNNGAPRDIPDGAIIHKSVPELHQAGILQADQLPKTGGDNAHISPTGALLAWTRQAAKAADAKKSNGTSAKPKAVVSTSYDVSSVLSHALAKRN